MQKFKRKLKKFIRPWVPEFIIRWLKKQRKPIAKTKTAPKVKPRLSPTLQTTPQLRYTKPPQPLKIGIISINIHSSTLNLACPLHSIAFAQVLRNLGYDNVVVDYLPIYAPKNAEHDIKYPLQRWQKASDDNPKKQAQVAMWTALQDARAERYDKFNAFIDKHYTLTKNQYTAATLDKLDSAEGINCYIAATDVIWSHYTKGFDKGFFLACRAMKDSYRIAYAASRGSSKYEKVEVRKQFLAYIKNIHAISTRETSLQNYIAAQAGINTTHVLDPVALLDKSYYQSLMTCPVEKGYVLLYLAMEPGDELTTLAAKFAQKHNLDLIELSEFYYHPKQTGYDRHRVIYNIGTDEWLGYINNAAYIFTQSLHGTYLSILLEKQFFCGKRGNDKVDMVMENFGLLWRKVDGALDKHGNILVDDIDYDKVKAEREPLMEQSMSFLRNALANAEAHVNAPRDYLTSGDKAHCSCCAACEKTCPHAAITMQADNEGFSLPVIDHAKCTKCLACVRVCQRNTKPQLYTQPKQVYLSFNNNEDERKYASSGGIFMAMAKHVLAKGGAVIGVRFNEQYEALYDIAHTLENCLPFRFSKYVEAADNDIYPKTKAALQTGQPVLFTGTPCKIAGLLNYLGKPYDNLYCADLLCHATNSPLILRKYLQEKQKKNGKLAHFQFRTPHAPQGPSTIEFIYENGKSEIGTRQDNLYLNAYLSKMTLKRSCYAVVAAERALRV